MATRWKDYSLKVQNGALKTGKKESWSKAIVNSCTRKIERGQIAGDKLQRDKTKSDAWKLGEENNAHCWYNMSNVNMSRIDNTFWIEKFGIFAKIWIYMGCITSFKNLGFHGTRGNTQLRASLVT